VLPLRLRLPLLKRPRQTHLRLRLPRLKRPRQTHLLLRLPLLKRPRQVHLRLRLPLLKRPRQVHLRLPLLKRPHQVHLRLLLLKQPRQVHLRLPLRLLLLTRAMRPLLTRVVVLTCRTLMAATARPLSFSHWLRWCSLLSLLCDKSHLRWPYLHVEPTYPCPLGYDVVIIDVGQLNSWTIGQLDSWTVQNKK
jgi:hypothetical protein